MFQIGDLFYRYEFFHPTEDQELKLYCFDYAVEKVTPNGVWINNGLPKFILSGGASEDGKWKAKRWAYSTREAALADFIRRREFEIRFLRRRLEFCESALDLAEELRDGRVSGIPREIRQKVAETLGQFGELFAKEDFKVGEPLRIRLPNNYSNQSK